MKTLQDQFVTYPIAKAMKDAGFNEPCFGVWNGREEQLYVGLQYDAPQNHMTNGCKAPLWQQATSWLRKEHSIFIEQKCDYGIDAGFAKNGEYIETHFEVHDLARQEIVFHVSDTFDAARTAAILKALELIKK